MSLIIEDGSIVAGANSFTDLAYARERATAYQITLPTDDIEAENALKAGALWIKQQEKSLQGVRVSNTQALSYPREDVVLYGFTVNNNEVPLELIDTQVAAAAEAGSGVNVLVPTKTNPSIKKKKMDELGELEYFNGGSLTQDSDNIRLAKSILYPLTLSAVNVGGGFKCVRG